MSGTPSPAHSQAEVQRLTEALRRLCTEGGSANRLVIGKGSAWFIARGAAGSSSVLLEAAASYYLPRGQKLRTEDVIVLRRDGFENAATGRNLHTRVSLGEAAAAEATARRILGHLVEVYRRPLEEPVELTEHLGDDEAISNGRLTRAIRELAGDRSQRKRNRMYSELLSAELLVPVDTDGELLAFGDLEGMPVFGCFTDTASLEAWDPRRLPTRTVPGVEFFPALMMTRVGSLLINPSGRLGGELYRNEIEALAGAARQRRAR